MNLGWLKQCPLLPATFQGSSLRDFGLTGLMASSH